MLWCDVFRRDEKLRLCSGEMLTKLKNQVLVRTNQPTTLMAHMEKECAKVEGRAVDMFAPIARMILVLTPGRKKQIRDMFGPCYRRTGVSFFV